MSGVQLPGMAAGGMAAVAAQGDTMTRDAQPDYDHVASEPHSLRVLKYRADTGDHECRFDDPRSLTLGTVYVDLMADGGLRGHAPESLVGKLIEVEYAYPWSYLAVGAKVVQASDRL